MIELRNLTKIYNGNTKNQVIALDHVSFTLPEAGMVFLLGKSGSGKTTLLNLLGGLDAPTEGELCIDGTSSTSFRQKDWNAYRNNYVGFVFQEYNLLDDLTIGENIALALNLQGKQSKASAGQKISAVLEQVGLSGYGVRKPSELSGGQQQRIAIARALVKNPRMILADEPSGALDSENGQQIFDLLKEISQEKLVVVVSHDQEFARKYADRIIELLDGCIILDTAPIPSTQVGLSHKALSLKRTNLPIGAAFKQGLYGMRRKKLHLTVTVFLCAVAFALVGIADMMAAYNWRTVLINSLYASGLSYSAIRKEVYLDYDFTKTNLSLPEQEAVTYFNTQGNLKLSAGFPDWYGGYMFTDTDLAQLSQRTGTPAKGIYRPGAVDMQIFSNYVQGEYTQALISDAGRVPRELVGFVELTDADLEPFGLNLLAGRLPADDSNEIAISKYLYDAFVLAGYRSYSGPEVLFRYNNLSPGSTNKDPSVDIARITMTWNEFISDKGLSETSKLWTDWAAEYGASNRSISFYTAEGDTPSLASPNDILGMPLFIAGRSYTITGVIDTGFDAADYANITLDDLEADPLTLSTQTRALVQRVKDEQAAGLSCVAFVGEGSVARISAQYPQAVTVENMELLINGCRYSNYAIKTNTLVNKSTLPYELQESYMLDESETRFFLTNEYQEYLKHNYPTEECELTVSWNDGHAAYSGTDWNASGMRGGSNDVVGLNWYSKVYPITALILNEYAFTLLTEGRAGTYAYAVSAMPKEREAIAQYVDGCNLEHDGIRFSLDNEVADQLSGVDGIMQSLVRIFRLIGIAMILFSLLLFAGFMVISISQQKRRIGILRALGTGNQDVFVVFSIESLLVAAVISIVSTALTWVAATEGNALLENRISSMLQILHFGSSQVVLTFVLSFGIAILASIIPILYIARQKPIDAIRR